MRTLLMTCMMALFTMPTTAEAGKKNNSLTIKIDGEEVHVVRDGEVIDDAKIVRRGGNIVVLDSDGEDVVWSSNLGSYDFLGGAWGHGADELRIGVYLDSVEPALAAQLGIAENEGIVVSGLVEDGPAESGGMQKYDIIVELEGEAVDDTGDVREVLNDLEEGDHVAVTVLRAGKRTKLDLVPEKGVAFASSFGGDDPFVSFFGGDGGEVAVIQRTQAARARAVAEAQRAAERAYAAARAATGQHRNAEDLVERLKETEERLEELEKRLEEAGKGI